MVNLQITKLANKSYILLSNSNIIRYSITIKNLGDERASFVKVHDVLSKGAQIISDSFTINGCCQNFSSCNKNITIEFIDPGSSVTISFQVSLNYDSTINSITNKVIVSYLDYYGNIYSVESNELTIPVININLCLVKSVDKQVASIGDVLNYTILVRNNSNIDLTEALFYDCLPPNVALFPGSVTINSIPQYISSFDGGLNLGTIKAQENIIVNFEVQVISLTSDCRLCNSASLTYNYTLINYDTPITSIGETTSNCTETILKPSNCLC